MKMRAKISSILPVEPDAVIEGMHTATVDIDYDGKGSFHSASTEIHASSAHMAARLALALCDAVTSLEAQQVPVR